MWWYGSQCECETPPAKTSRGSAEGAPLQFTKSLSSLAVEYVDLFLLHYPACWPELCGADVAPAGKWQDSWKALETLVDKGLIRAIGK